MVLVANEQWMLVYEPEKVMRYHVYFSTNSMFRQRAWHGQNFNTRALRNFFREDELRKAKAKRDAEKRVSKKFVS